MARRHHPFLALALASGLAMPARASEPATQERIGVLPIAIEGELSPSWRAQLQTRLQEGLARGKRPVVAIDRTCKDEACLRELGDAKGVRWLARAHVTVRDRDFDVELELLDAKSGARATNSAGTCEVCAIAEVGDMLADRAGVLDRKLDALAQAPPRVRFESRPTGALVYVDGELVGNAPVARTIAEGRHRARAELERYLPIEVQFDAVAGTDDAVLLELSPLPKRSRTPQRVAGWSLLGIGLAATAVGAPLVALHGRPYERRCSGMDVDGDGDCRFTYGTRTGGAVALAIGGAAIVTAIVLLATARRKHHGAISKAPMLGGIPQHSPR